MLLERTRATLVPRRLSRPQLRFASYPRNAVNDTCTFPDECSVCPCQNGRALRSRRHHCRCMPGDKYVPADRGESASPHAQLTRCCPSMADAVRRSELISQTVALRPGDPRRFAPFSLFRPSASKVPWAAADSFLVVVFPFRILPLSKGQRLFYAVARSKKR